MKSVKSFAMKWDVFELAAALKIDALNAKDCQHCANIYNSDVLVLAGGDTLIGSECVNLINLLKDKIGSLSKLFLEISLDTSKSSACDEEKLIVVLKQLVAYCIVVIVHGDSYDMVLQGIIIMFELYSKFDCIKTSIITMNALSVISNAFHRVLLCAVSDQEINSKCIRGHIRNTRSYECGSDDDGEAVDNRLIVNNQKS